MATTPDGAVFHRLSDDRATCAWDAATGRLVPLSAGRRYAETCAYRVGKARELRELRAVAYVTDGWVIDTQP